MVPYTQTRSSLAKVQHNTRTTDIDLPKDYSTITSHSYNDNNDDDGGGMHHWYNISDIATAAVYTLSIVLKTKQEDETKKSDKKNAHIERETITI